MELPKTMYARICRDEDGYFTTSASNVEEMFGFEYGTYRLIEPAEQETITGENG